jgi:hypothetical protein
MDFSEIHTSSNSLEEAVNPAAAMATIKMAVCDNYY